MYTYEKKMTVHNISFLVKKSVLVHKKHNINACVHCKPGLHLNSCLTHEGRKRLNWVKYASPGGEFKLEKANKQ